MSDALTQKDAPAWPPRFTLDQERVLKLFIGDAFYSSADASLREAVLNAIDACSLRAQTPGFVSHIAVTFDRASLIVTIEDNGVGMSKAELDGLFTKVGASASNLAAKDQPARQRAIGTFGIGVISYFLVCDKYEVQTKRDGGEALGLRFGTAMLDGRTPAEVLPAERSETGTTLRLHLKNQELFQLLLARFPHWMRDVSGLTAQLLPDGKDVPQGGIARAVRPVEAPLPEWIEAAHMGPPKEFSIWDTFDGRAKVDVLYRGVHVDRLEVPPFWGIEGAIHVDPRHFRPKLNREGFVGDELRSQVGEFLKRVHPLSLLAALTTLREDLRTDQMSSWSLTRWAAIWLAIPRSSEYKEASDAWDREFASRPTFHLLGLSDADSRDVSISDLQTLDAKEIFVAPPNLAGATAVTQQAVRVLRARASVVIQGIARDPNYLAHASWVGQTTSDLLLTYFQPQLPPLKQVETMANALVAQDSVADVYTTPRVRLVQLGAQAAPLVVIGREVWVNIECQAGKNLVRDICERNQGTLGLLIACLIHSPAQTHELAPIVGPLIATPRLGPVMRQHLRALVS